ncbi:MAG: hypothetical protein IJ600_02985 [Lachnospiraceae bacterium]|nr:hypothetical protein [Lachnospiraceae bacterium]
MVVLTGNDYGKRHQSLQKLREQLKASFADASQAEWERYSASVGMAEFSADDKTVEPVFKRADQYMYEDKIRFKDKIGIHV